MENNYKDFAAKLPSHLDDPNWLSEAIIQLAAINYQVGIEMAQAGFLESESIERFLNQIQENGKRMAVSEAEKRAIVQTLNQYENLKLQRESIMETINAIKHRITVLSWEFKH